MVMSEMVQSYFESPGTPSLADSESRLALGRAGRPDEAAAACLFLCSEAAGCITGVSLPVDGGWQLYDAA
jgi:NAD(P)-dependent dehydrogenase (short-subunit alcohol dehydrogenase family)